MKRILLIFSAMLSLFFVSFYIIWFAIMMFDRTPGNEWGLLAMFVMLPTVLLLLVGAILNILYNVKKKNNLLLASAIFYTLASVIVYQIFYFSILQALITWFFWVQNRKISQPETYVRDSHHLQNENNH